MGAGGTCSTMSLTYDVDSSQGHLLFHPCLGVFESIAWRQSGGGGEKRGVRNEEDTHCLPSRHCVAYPPIRG